MSAAQIIMDRKTYVPGWYVPHSTLDVDVKWQGEPLGFKVSEVLPERRWAIDSDGNVMSPFEFEPKYKQFHMMVVAPNGQLISITQANKYYDPNVDPIPFVKDWVGKAIDEHGCEVDILFLKRQQEEPTELLPVYNAEGEIGKPSEKKPVGFDGIRMTESDKEDAIRAEERAKVLAEIEAMNAMTPKGGPDPEPQGVAAPCGEVKKSKAGAAAHARHCDACKEAEAA